MNDKCDRESKYMSEVSTLEYIDSLLDDLITEIDGCLASEDQIGYSLLKSIHRDAKAKSKKLRKIYETELMLQKDPYLDEQS